MSYRVEISGGPFSRERQADLVRLLVSVVGIEPEEAELNVLLAPVTVGPVDPATRDQLMGALRAAGFEATATGAPVYSNGPAYAPLAAAAPPAVAPPAPAYEAPPVYAEAPARSNGALIAIAAVLGLLVVGLGVTALLANRSDTPRAVVEDAGPPGYSGSEPVQTTTIQDDLVDDPVGTAVVDDGEMIDEPAPTRPSSDAAEYALGYSPRRGVNWDVFVGAERVRTSAVPTRTPIPIRDVPSGRNGDAIGAVAYGSQVQTVGCLARRDDGGRWCQVVDNQGWIYDRYLQTGDVPRRAPAPSSPPPAAAPTQAIIVMGSYRPGDSAGLEARYAQAQLAGVALETGPSENYGMSPGYIVIVSGPYERAQADRVLARVKTQVLDAFLHSVR